MTIRLWFLVFLLTTGAVAARAAEEGKVFLRSEPAGAEVYVVTKTDDGKTETKLLGKTANLFKLPMGKNTLLLKLPKYREAVAEIEVRDTTIVKPDPVKLEPVTYAVDIVILEEGWQIAVDKQPETKDGQPVTAPATLNLSFGKHEIKLTKNGFADITKTVDVAKAMLLEIKDKPMKVTPPAQTKAVESTGDSSIVGKYQVTVASTGWRATWELKADQTLTSSQGAVGSGKWAKKGSKIELTWSSGNVEEYNITDGTPLTFSGTIQTGPGKGHWLSGQKLQPKP